MISKKDFLKVDMRVGTIIKAELNAQAKKKAYKLQIDFGPLGIKSTSAQITDLYSLEELINHQVIAVVNFPSLKIGDILSEVLVLGVDSPTGVVLLNLDQKCENGRRIY